MNDQLPATSSPPLLYWLTCLLLFALPFELVGPLVRLPWFQFTNLELLLGVVGLAWLVAAWRGGVGRPSRTLLLPAGAFLLVALLSALLAPAFRPTALKSALRLASGLLPLLLVYAAAEDGDERRRRGLLWAILLGAGLSALLGLAEWAGVPLVAPLLAQFKASPTFVGNVLRVSASFQYATIAAMYWEMAIPLALLLATIAATRPGRAAALAVALLLTLTTVLTLTRASFITLALLLVGLLLAGWVWPRLRPLRRPAGVTLLWLSGLLLWSLVASDSFRQRLATENDLNWYGAQYDAPAGLTLAAGEQLTLAVPVTNTGRAAWDSRAAYPIVLGYRWLSQDGQQVYQLPPGSAALPRDVRPGETAIFSATVMADLPPGQYRLAWGMRQAQFAFYSRGVAEAETRVVVRPGRVTPPLPPTTPRSQYEQAASAPEIPTRRELWLAAGRMWWQRPLLGGGPHTFRLRFGPYLGLANWDRRTHANNLYLELLADLGLLGLAAFAWLVVAAGRVLYLAAGRKPLWAAALAASLLAVGLHGVLDYFFEFWAVYWLFWALLGLALALPRPGSGRER